jgi:hypothetical protein
VGWEEEEGGARRRRDQRLDRGRDTAASKLLGAEGKRQLEREAGCTTHRTANLLILLVAEAGYGSAFWVRRNEPISL